MKKTNNLTEKYASVIAFFEETMPVVAPELVFRNSYELLVAVILSAQCTDKRVNLTTPAFFEKYPTAESLAKTDVDSIYQLIKSISYPNNKAKNLLGMAQALVANFGGEVPSSFDDLLSLPGVGRKTANVVSVVAFGKNAMPVDTHVFRVANRIGLVVNAKTPLEVEQQLVQHLPTEILGKAHHWLLLHGRYTCTARNPKCSDCRLSSICEEFKKKC